MQLSSLIDTKIKNIISILSKFLCGVGICEPKLYFWDGLEDL